MSPVFLLIGLLQKFLCPVSHWDFELTLTFWRFCSC